MTGDNNTQLSKDELNRLRSLQLQTSEVYDDPESPLALESESLVENYAFIESKLRKK